ncbi:hypothetical protein SEPCBS57363_002526 [Sporothrix epigloea]|uniref:PHD-type domain-containing protein n=1 Tax=Sporothrix epigloea TaxID=1892477 RepID=A0ABP0DGD9_9PEZI
MPPVLPTSVRATRSRFSSPSQSIEATGPVDPASTSDSGSSSTRHGGSGIASRPNGTSGNSGIAGSNAQRAMMARWLEPPVQSKTSFEEAGFQRHGVFEGMAPLGILPKTADLTKRINGLPEEKQYRDGPPSNGRQTAKQQQKKKELRSHQDRLSSQDQQPGYEVYSEIHDNNSAMHSKIKEPESRAQDQTTPPIQTKKIILKRPSARKDVLESISVDIRRPNRANGEAGGDESGEGEIANLATSSNNDADRASIPKMAFPHSMPATPSPPTAVQSRQNTSFRSAATRQAPKPQPESRLGIEDNIDDLDQGGQVTGMNLQDSTATRFSSQERDAANDIAELELDEKPALESPKPTKRPVGRPKSRSSLSIKPGVQKEEAQTKAGIGAGAGAEPRERAEQLAVDESQALIPAQTPRTPTPEITQQPVTTHEMPQKDEIIDSDNDSFDSEAEDNDNFGGKPTAFDSSHLPLITSHDFPRPRSDSNATEINRDVTDRVVDIAVKEALRHYRYPTAWALRTLYDEQSADQTFLAMVEDVFQQTADRETLDTFVRMVHERKKEGRTGNKACHHFNAMGSNFTLPRPIPAPYADLIMVNPRQHGADGSVTILEDAADISAHAKKRVKLTNDDDRQQTLATGLTPVAMHTFAPPLISVPLPGSNATAEFVSHGGEPHTFATPRKAAVKIKTLSQSPKTVSTPPKPSITPRRPGRPLGSKNKSLAEKATAAAGTTSSSKKSIRKDDNGIALASSTPSSTQRRLRNRSTSLASSVSSLSSVASLTTPSKALRNRKDDDTARLQQASGKVRGKGDDTAMHEDPSNTTSSIGWTTGTVQQKTNDIASIRKSLKKGDGGFAKTSTPANQHSVKRGGKAAGRGGPGSGRGGRRPGAGRPPKNRALIPPKTTSTAEPAPAPAPTPTPETATQPIATRNRLSAQKSPKSSTALTIFLTSPSQKNAQAHTTGTQDSQAPPKRVSAAASVAVISASAKEEMPAAVENDSVVRPISVAKRATQNESSKSRSSATALPSSTLNSIDAAPKSLGKSESSDPNEARLDCLRREARSVTNSLGLAPESFFRGGAGPASTDASLPAEAVTALSGQRISVADVDNGQPVLETPQLQRHRQLRATTTATRTTRSARKRAFDEVDDELSPISSSFPFDEAPPSRLQTPVAAQQNAAIKAQSGDSRAGTPAPKSKKQRVGIRIKSSPVKKKTGTFAGMPRASGERGSPVANGATNSQDDNDDYCASCGGSGDLVCCDGCTRSFHFNCVDPPVHEDRDLPDEWFCNVCIGRRNPAASTRYTGIFGALLNIMELRNSSAFRLPSETRDYFEGVKTGADGEYEDVVVVGANRTRKRGYEEAPDFFRIRDNDGNPVLCHQCNYSAKDDKPIIPCAFCGLWWHIDCLQPPMANPPVLRNWRCPAHADDILAKLPVELGPAHRFRKIKGASVIKPAYSRGMINNGYIELNFDDDFSDNNSGWTDWQSFGRVQRTGAKGVKLDFLEQIRKEQSRGGQRRARMRRRKDLFGRSELQPGAEIDSGPAAVNVVVAAQLKRAILCDRSLIDEAQAAQNLSALCTIENTDRTGDLINALLAQADSSVISMMAQGNALNIQSGSTLSQQDRTSLEAMRARINVLLSKPSSSPLPKEAIEHDNAVGQQNDCGDKPEAFTFDIEKASTIVMEKAHAEESVENRVPETHEVMSLVSDNGEIGDEDPPPITTPLDTVDKDCNSNLWSARHFGSSVTDPGSGSKPLGTAVKADPEASGIEKYTLCDHDNKKNLLLNASETDSHEAASDAAKDSTTGLNTAGERPEK